MAPPGLPRRLTDSRFRHDHWCLQRLKNILFKKVFSWEEQMPRALYFVYLMFIAVGFGTIEQSCAQPVTVTQSSWFCGNIGAPGKPGFNVRNNFGDIPIPDVWYAAETTYNTGNGQQDIRIDTVTAALGQFSPTPQNSYVAAVGGAIGGIDSVQMSQYNLPNPQEISCKNPLIAPGALGTFHLPAGTPVQAPPPGLCGQEHESSIAIFDYHNNVTAHFEQVNYVTIEILGHGIYRVEGRLYPNAWSANHVVDYTTPVAAAFIRLSHLSPVATDLSLTCPPH
jgi:hypothetical protein